MLEFGSSGEQQRSHARAWCRTTKSGLATRRRVSPAWPSWPPLALPDLPRRLRGARGFFFNPLLEGGFELFVLSSPSRRRSSATKASSSAIRRSFEASNSWISGGMTIPLLIQIRRTLSPKIRQPRPVSTNLWQFGLTTTWELPHVGNFLANNWIRRCFRDRFRGKAADSAKFPAFFRATREFATQSDRSIYCPPSP